GLPTSAHARSSCALEVCARTARSVRALFASAHHPETARCVEGCGVHGALLEREQRVLDRRLEHATWHASCVRRRTGVTPCDGAREIGARLLDDALGALLGDFLARRVLGRALRAAIGKQDNAEAYRLRRGRRKLRHFLAIGQEIEADG